MEAYRKSGFVRAIARGGDPSLRGPKRLFFSHVKSGFLGSVFWFHRTVTATMAVAQVSAMLTVMLDT